MAEFKSAIRHVLKWEGGLVDHPQDPGGLTNRGITWAFFEQYAGILGVEAEKQNLIDLTEAQAMVLFRETFWGWCFGNSIKSQAVATTVFDFFINADELKMVKGPGTASTAISGLQRVLKTMGSRIVVDGIMGPKTLTAVNEVDSKSLFLDYQEMRVNYYNYLASKKPSLKIFLRGWLRRVYDIPPPEE